MKILEAPETLEGSVQLPISKSMSNRAQMMSALAGSLPDEKLVSEARDSRILYNALVNLLSDSGPIEIFVEDAGTPLRFLTAYVAATPGLEATLRGTPRLHQRPMAPLIEALQALGADIQYLEKPGFAPLYIRGRKLAGTALTLDPATSSQFISALCMIAPVCQEGLQIILDNRQPQVSFSYIQLTLDMMKQAGFDMHVNQHIVNIPAQKPKRYLHTLERDWSSACFFYSMALLSPESNLFFPDLSLQSYQGDQYIVTLMELLGFSSQSESNGTRLRSVRPCSYCLPNPLDLVSFPDLAIPLLVACALRYPEAEFTGLSHLSLKESNRIEALQQELLRINIIMHEKDGRISFEKKSTPVITDIHFHHHQDHRILMACCIPSMLGYKPFFKDIEPVNKSFPGFFDQLHRIGFRIKAR